MNYKFRINDQVVRVFINDLFDDKKETAGVVTIRDNGKKYDRTLRYDENGKKFFTWNHEKIFFDDFLAMTPDEFVNAIHNKSNVYDEDLCHTLLKYGINCLRVEMKQKPLDRIDFGDIIIGFKTSSNHEDESKFNWIEYRFIEEYCRMPKDNYKLKLVPANEDEYDIYPKEDYYTSDLIGLLKACSDEFRIKVA